MPLVALDTAGMVRDTLALLSLAAGVQITAGAAADGVLSRRHPLERGDTWQFARDGSGASIGRFRLPATSRVSHANRTEAWVVEKDALDIPYVARYEIVPG